ncbi:MAG: methyltransferase [Pseudomonadota bacterium]
MKKILTLVALCALGGCGQEQSATQAPEASSAPVETAAPASPPSLADILDARPDQVKARYQYRHPQETLEFFGVEPGMTVVEALPGGGWYSKLLLPYLGSAGQLVGADYPLELWPNFSFMTEEALEAKKTWVDDWTEDAEGWRSAGDAGVSAFQMAALPESMHGTADAVLFIRALHNLARFEETGGFLTAAVQDAYQVLKPGGVVGVVQHHARDEMPDEWADGNNGYLKKGFVIEAMEAAGFEFVGSSEVNANPSDQPTTDDIVWRLPPSLQTSRDNPDLQAAMREIGESNRMTLKFRKPAS